MNTQVQPAHPIIRPLRADDLAAVLAIETRAYDYPWTETVFRDCIKAGYSLWVLDAGDGLIDGLIGYGVLSAAAGEAHILNLCVDAQRRGQGHGRRLLNRLIDVARWHRAERVFLEVRPSNTRAIALYHRAGFCEIGNRPNYYPARNGREDAVVMARELLLDAE